MIINDLVNPVVAKIRQRTELIPIIPYYIATAILDLTEDIEIAELAVRGPMSNFVQNQAEYPTQGYDPLGVNGNPFVSATEHRITIVLSWFVWFNTTGSITLGEDTGYEICKRNLRVVEPMSMIGGIPSVFTFFGDKRNKGTIMVGQMPDNPYATRMRYQREHPFTISTDKLAQARADTSLCNQLAASPIMMPYDWNDIIVYYAAEKICDDVGMNEVGQLYHQKLFGYKDKYGSEIPGLIMVKTTRSERDTAYNSRAMRPVVKRYT